MPVESLKSLKGISSFVAVATAGSFTAAAKQQGVSAVAVGKNVSTLERQLGVRLFQRTTRKVSLTAEGRAFYAQCLGPLRALESAQAGVQTSAKALSGLVRVTSAAPFGMHYILPLIPAFHAAHPAVHIELHLDDRVNDMVAEGYDVGIRIGPLRDCSLVARPIASLPFVVCASPAYLMKCGTPHTLDDLQHHNCLRVRSIGRSTPMPWLLRDAPAHFDETLRGNFLVNDFTALVTAAVQGQGVIYTPLPLVMPLFRSGQLKPLLTKLIQPRLTVYLYYLNRKNLPARTRCFVDFVLDALGKAPDLQMPPAVLVAPFLQTM
jgi:DNA-binding transcriptional LysR family regulator